MRKEQKALHTLLPFLGWLQPYDHNKDKNFVVDYLENDLCRIRAIDFENAFDWQAGEEVIIPPKPACLVENLEPQAVRNMLTKIEQLDPAQITDCCSTYGQGIYASETLQRRERLLKQAIKESGWL